MDNKVITILLIAVVIISVLSLAVAVNLNTTLNERIITIIKGADANTASVGLTIDETPFNSADG